jgi:hypothetical protein
MSAKLSKMAPIAVVAAILGYLCWPYLDDPAADAKSKAATKPAQSLSALLSPAATGNLRSDLFEIPQVATPTVAKKAASPANQVSAAKKATADAAARADEFKHFVLSGTYVSGGRRYAVINGALYAEGEQIAATGKGAKTASTYMVSRVEIDKVVLSFQGENKELHYADPVAPPEPRATGIATSAVDAAQSLTSTTASENAH